MEIIGKMFCPLGKEKKRYKKATNSVSHYFSHLWLPVVTPCFVLSLTQYISITFISLLFSNLLSLCETQWITKKRQFWYGLCSLALQQETVAFEQSHKDPEIHKLDQGRKKKKIW